MENTYRIVEDVPC